MDKNATDTGTATAVRPDEDTLAKLKEALQSADPLSDDECDELFGDLWSDGDDDDDLT